jgi:hypothetical protein
MKRRVKVRISRPLRWNGDDDLPAAPISARLATLPYRERQIVEMFCGTDGSPYSVPEISRIFKLPCIAVERILQAYRSGNHVTRSEPADEED